MAALEGVLTTRDLGYGGAWLSLAAVGLALPLQARRCYHHSCESDLFQVKQEDAFWHFLAEYFGTDGMPPPSQLRNYNSQYRPWYRWNVIINNNSVLQ